MRFIYGEAKIDRTESTFEGSDVLLLSSDVLSDVKLGHFSQLWLEFWSDGISYCNSA